MFWTQQSIQKKHCNSCITLVTRLLADLPTFTLKLAIFVEFIV